MRRKKLLFLLIAPFAIAAFIFIGGEVVMHLWNWLTPALFGFRLITFWQAIGLLILCRILFGGFGHHGHRSSIRGRMRDRWDHMTPEEREKFREKFQGRWGYVPPTRASEPPE